MSIRSGANGDFLSANLVLWRSRVVLRNMRACGYEPSAAGVIEREAGVAVSINEMYFKNSQILGPNAPYKVSDISQARVIAARLSSAFAGRS